MKIFNNNFIWKPNISYWDFKFNDNINNYLKKYKITKEINEYNLNWDNYKSADYNIYFHCEKSIITSILIDDHLIYKNKNLIGLTVEEVIKILKIKPDEIEKNFLSIDKFIDIYEFYELGLTLWVHNEIVIEATVQSSENFSETKL